SRDDLDFIPSRRKCKWCNKVANEEMMACDHAGLWDVKATTPHERQIAVNPRSEVLNGIISPNAHIHTLKDTSALCSREQQCTEVDFGYFVTLGVRPKVNNRRTGHPNGAATKECQPSGK